MQRCANLCQQLQAVGTFVSIVAIDRNLFEECIDRFTQPRKFGHGRGVVLVTQKWQGLVPDINERLIQIAFFFQAQKIRGNVRVIGRSVLFLFDAQNVRRTLVSGHQVDAAFARDKIGKRFNTGQQADKIVLAIQGKHGRHQIMADTLFTQMDFETVSKEGQKVFDRLVTTNICRVLGNCKGKDTPKRQTQTVFQNQTNDTQCRTTQSKRIF